MTAAALAAGRGAVASGWAAGAWWAFAKWDGRDVEVIVPRDGGRKIDGIRASRARLDRRDVWVRDGIAITSPARTALDLAATMPRQALRRMLRQAQAERLLTVAQLADTLARAPRHRGAAALRAVIDDGPTPTRSAAEDLLLDLIARAGLAAPEVNPPLTIDGTALMPDLLWRDRKLVVEVDGERFHASAIARRDDAHRQALLEAHGHRVLRVGYDQLTRRPAQTIARIAAALTPAAGTPRTRPSSRRRPRPASSGPSARGGSGA